VGRRKKEDDYYDNNMNYQDGYDNQGWDYNEVNPDNKDNSDYQDYPDGNSQYEGPLYEEASYEESQEEYLDNSDYRPGNGGYTDYNYQDEQYEGNYEMSEEDMRAEFRHKRRVRNKIIVVIVTLILLLGIAAGSYYGVTKLIDVIGTPKESELNKELKERENALLELGQDDSGEQEQIAVEAPEEN